MSRCLILLFTLGCTTTLEFGDLDASSSQDGGAIDAVAPFDSGTDSASGLDAAGDDAGAQDAGRDAATDAGTTAAQLACRAGCEEQNINCGSFNASLCFELCDSSGDARRSGFATCTEGPGSFNCNFPLDMPSCFSMLSGGVEAEARCRQACDRYEDCDFGVNPTCRERCVTRLPADNDAFVSCVDGDLVACTLGCL